MAVASSRIGAQEALINPCDLCEDDENVNWFCKDCLQNLCDRCKKVHLRTVSCKNHRLVTIFEGVVITKRNVSILCQEHDEPFSFYCRSCEKNICQKCLSSIHKKHDFIDILELQSELHTKVDGVIRKKEDEIGEMTTNLKALEKCEKENVETLKQRCQKIDERVKEIQCIAEEEGKKLKTTLQATMLHRLTETNESKQKLEAKKLQYEDKIKTVINKLELETTSTLHQFVENSISNLQSLKPVSCSTPQSDLFSVGKVKTNLIKDMIGTIVYKGDESTPKEKSKESKEEKERFIELPRTNVGFGFSLIGGIDTYTPIHVSKIIYGGSAYKSGCLRKGDMILSINGKSLNNASHDTAVNLVKEAKETLKLCVLFNPDLK